MMATFPFSQSQENRIVDLDDDGEEEIKNLDSKYASAAAGKELIIHKSTGQLTMAQKQEIQRRRHSTKTRPYWLLGRYQKVRTHYVLSRHGDINSEEIQEETIFVPCRFIAKFSAHGYAKMRNDAGGHWKTCILPIVVVPNSAAIFQACEQGDVQEIVRLLESRQASIYDTTESGLTPLHVSNIQRLKPITPYSYTPGCCGSSTPFRL